MREGSGSQVLVIGFKGRISESWVLEFLGCVPEVQYIEELKGR